MRSTSEDLSMTSYALAGLIILAQALTDLRTALVIGSGLVALWLVISLLMAGGTFLTRSNEDVGRPCE